MNKSGAPLIKIEKMSVIFNQGKPNEARVFDNIDLDIYPHEYLILFGPSGCGKSTLLSVISGLLPPTSGKVLIDGKDMATFTEEEKLKYHRRQVGMIFQSFHLIPTLSIIDNVCLPRAFVGDDSPARERDGMNLLKRFEIDAHAEKFPNDVSGGQRQRAAIARALVNGPSIIVADEPVGNLDSKAAYNVFRILEELNEVDKKLIVLVTHDPSHLAYGDRVIYMQDGKITKTVEVLERRSPTMKTGRIYLEEQERIAGAWESFKSGMLGKAWELYKKCGSQGLGAGQKRGAWKSLESVQRRKNRRGMGSRRRIRTSEKRGAGRAPEGEGNRAHIAGSSGSDAVFPRSHAGTDWDASHPFQGPADFFAYFLSSSQESPRSRGEDDSGLCRRRDYD